GRWFDGGRLGWWFDGGRLGWWFDGGWLGWWFDGGWLGWWFDGGRHGRRKCFVPERDVRHCNSHYGAVRGHHRDDDWRPQ
ncbi:MAG: hypothetical protein INH41_19420, partial [Myxococcaceae bacterium]|nr:hypothetical protein [Myxococcaceae bacterium]